MVRLAPALLCAVLLLPAAARADGPVCGTREVLDVVAQELQARGIAAELDGSSVGERSAPGSLTILCSVKLLFRTYDANAYGGAPQYTMTVRSYEVRRQSHSLLVRVLN